MKSKIDYPPSIVDYMAGEPVWQIALKYGVTPKTVRKRARLLGLVGRKEKIVGARALRIVKLYKRGALWSDICRIEEIDGHTLSDVLRREGVRLRTRR